MLGKVAFVVRSLWQTPSGAIRRHWCAGLGDPDQAMARAVEEGADWADVVASPSVGGLAKLYADSDVFVLATSSRGDTRGVRPPDGSAEVLAVTIESLLDDPTTLQRLGRNAHEWAAERFSPERYRMEVATALVADGRPSALPLELRKQRNQHREAYV